MRRSQPSTCSHTRNAPPSNRSKSMIWTMLRWWRPGRDPRLVHEHHRDPLVRDQLGADQLDHDRALEAVLADDPAEVDLAHPAAREQLVDSDSARAAGEARAQIMTRAAGRSATRGRRATRVASDPHAESAASPILRVARVTHLGQPSGTLLAGPRAVRRSPLGAPACRHLIERRPSGRRSPFRA